MVQHSWVSGGCRNELELELPIRQVVQTHVIPSVDHMDPDVLASMTSLGCFKDRERLNRELLNSTHNMEKVIYFLLLDRKRRRPACEDEDESVGRIRAEADPPRKRIDQRNGKTSASCENLVLAQGSPFVPRRFPNGISPASKLYVHCTPNHLRRSMRQTKSGSDGVGGIGSVKPGIVSMIKSISPASVLGSGSPLPSPRSYRQRTSSISLPGNESPAAPVDTPPGSPGLGSGVYWRSRLNIFKNSIIGTPRFHRRKMQG